MFVDSKNSFGAQVSSSYADLVYSLATDEQPALAAVDGCDAFDCNKACGNFDQCYKCGELVPSDSRGSRPQHLETHSQWNAQ